ncbi:transporter [Arachidicoccus ginsenosidimutans]|uniref:TolC family protein n=1 Tax=Arachidicoccus sp. BS20 TaxID=1850526 RepID=UPI0007F0914A|nr:TolC family protein [Arachidicoccus sp. BS20]ANI87992.1 transporter [Arachidicoccus sp. BS20]
MKQLLKKCRLLLVVVVLAAPVFAFAQQTDTTLDLRGAIQLSLNNSKQLKLSSAKVEQALASVSEAKNNQLPDLKVSGAYYYLTKPHINISPDLSSNDDDDNSSDDSNSGSSFPNVHQAVYGMLTASLPIFAGGKITNGIKSAQYLAEAAKLDAGNDKEEVIQNTIEAYNNLYKAIATVKLVQENLATAKQRVKDFQSMEANGIVARNDLMKVELQESNVELALLDAENNRKIANYNFNIMLGLNDSTVIGIDSSDIDNDENVPSLSDLENLARSNRFDYLALLDRQQAAEYNTKVVKGNQYPSLAFAGGYMAADIPKALSLYNVVNVGVSVSYDIGSLYKNNAKVRQAKAEEKILAISRDKLNDDIHTQIYTAYNNYFEALKKIDVYKVAIAQAEENYRITKNKYDNSLETTTNLLDADVALLQAKINYEYARADAAVVYNKIYETVGTLNKKFNNLQ